jgi:hypothetical protein
VTWEILGAHGRGELQVHGETLTFYRKSWKPDQGAPWSFPPALLTVLKRAGPLNGIPIECSIEKRP